MPMMTSKTERLAISSSKKTTVLKLLPHSQLRRCYWPFVLLTSRISPLQNVQGPLLSYPFTFYTHTPLSIWASWVPSPSAPKFLSSAWEPHPSLLLLDLQGQLIPFSFFQLASPPRIHMDSWWAARNPNQGLKWTHNIAQNQSGAYGPEPCRI